MLPWRVSSVGAKAFGTSTSHGRGEEDRSLSRLCAGGRETMLASGSVLALFLGLPHLQCSMACSMQTLGRGKANTLVSMITASYDDCREKHSSRYIAFQNKDILCLFGGHSSLVEHWQFKPGVLSLFCSDFNFCLKRVFIFVLLFFYT